MEQEFFFKVVPQKGMGMGSKLSLYYLLIPALQKKIEQIIDHKSLPAMHSGGGWMPTLFVVCIFLCVEPGGSPNVPRVIWALVLMTPMLCVLSIDAERIIPETCNFYILPSHALHFLFPLR